MSIKEDIAILQKFVNDFGMGDEVIAFANIAYIANFYASLHNTKCSHITGVKKGNLLINDFNVIVIDKDFKFCPDCGTYLKNVS